MWFRFWHDIPSSILSANKALLETQFNFHYHRNAEILICRPSSLWRLDNRCRFFGSQWESQNIFTVVSNGGRFLRLLAIISVVASVGISSRKSPLDSFSKLQTTHFNSMGNKFRRYNNAQRGVKCSIQMWIDSEVLQCPRPVSKAIESYSFKLQRQAIHFRLHDKLFIRRTFSGSHSTAKNRWGSEQWLSIPITFDLKRQVFSVDLPN